MDAAPLDRRPRPRSQLQHPVGQGAQHARVNGRRRQHLSRTCSPSTASTPKPSRSDPTTSLATSRRSGCSPADPVKVAAIHYIGKESNRIEEALSGLVTDLDDVLTEYRDREEDPFLRLVAPLLRELPVEDTAAPAPDCRSAPSTEPAPASPSAGTGGPRTSPLTQSSTSERSFARPASDRPLIVRLY